MLAMAMYPGVQKKAQDELDRVVGPSRLPEFHDVESLPYIKAVVMETMRWITIVPLCIAHGSMEDDMYEGYFIPKGTVILPVSTSKAFSVVTGSSRCNVVRTSGKTQSHERPVLCD